MKHLFSGGVHPAGHKELSLTGAVERVIPRQVTIALQQHIGTPCTPQVKVGDQVALGQKIGDGEGLCAAVHSSVSGVVRGIGPRPHVSGQMVESVVIENDMRGKEAAFTPIAERDPEALLCAIHEAGIVGMGGAAFPGGVKARSALGKADTLIANGCECEPYITADDVLLTTQPRHVLRGLELLQKIVQPKRTVLAVEDNKNTAIEGLRRCMADFPTIELAVLPTRYPQGSEKQLIQSLTGREVASGQLPLSVGCAVFNVSTCAAVCRAVEEGRPVTERIVTVTGQGVSRPGNYLVPIGTSFRDLLAAAGGLRVNAHMVISGGPMMGRAQTDLGVSVVKATNCVLCLPQQGVGEGTHCIRCGRCVQVCPVHLQPLYLYRYGADREELQRLHLSDCIECGCCSYTCPAKLPLTERFRTSKRLVKEAKS